MRGFFVPVDVCIVSATREHPRTVTCVAQSTDCVASLRGPPRFQKLLNRDKHTVCGKPDETQVKKFMKIEADAVFIRLCRNNSTAFNNR